jgi:hypothetical protein
MIKHELIEKLQEQDRFLVTINYLENNAMKTVSFTNNFPVMDLQTAQFEASKTIGNIHIKEMAKLEEENNLEKNVKGLIE